MKVFDFDESIFTEESMKESAVLVNELGEIPHITTEYDDAIRVADAKVRDGTVVGASPTVMRAANLELYKARQKKQMVKFSSDNKRQELLRQLEALNAPFIAYLRECVEESINRLFKLTDFHRQTTQNMWTDKKSVEVQTNLNIICDARETLLTGRENISKLNHSPLKEILAVAEAISEEINSINLKKIESLTLTKTQADDIAESLKGTPPLTPVPRTFLRMPRLCVFRRKSATHSDPNRPPIPIQIGHLFRSKPAGHSEENRPPSN